MGMRIMKLKAMIFLRTDNGCVYYNFQGKGEGGGGSEHVFYRSEGVKSLEPREVRMIFRKKNRSRRECSTYTPLLYTIVVIARIA